MSKLQDDYYPSDDNALVFTLPEALSEIRALRSQKRVLTKALNAAEAALDGSQPQDDVERLRATALAAIERIRPLLPKRRRTRRTSTAARGR